MEKKFTDNEIIKALEWCEQFENNVVMCGRHGEKYTYTLQMMQIIKQALKDYNLQKAMIDGLIAGQETLQKALCDKNAEIERLQSMNQAKLDTIHDLMAEVENLKKFCNDFSETLSNNCKKADLEKVEAVNKAKSEARKEFAELIKQSTTDRSIDELLEEMEGEEVG